MLTVGYLYSTRVSTHSRLKAAGAHLTEARDGQRVSTHSRLKAAGWPSAWLKRLNNCFNTQPPEGGWLCKVFPNILACDVSTHSRLKAAGSKRLVIVNPFNSFNTQPPEGGWTIFLSQKFLT